MRDPFEKNVPGIGVGRDGCRTPMQWDATKSAGFSEADPWLPVPDNYRDQNVERCHEDKGSLYWLYRRLIDIRRKYVALAKGSYVPLKAQGDLLLFCRELGSGLIDQSQKMTAAAMQMAEKKVWAHRS